MLTDNLKILKRSFYFISIICFSIQLVLSNSLNDYICIIIIFVFNIFICSYCYKDENILNFPISSNIIFISSFINLGGILYLKTFEFDLLTIKLQHPLNTLILLVLFNLIIVFTHFIYTKSNNISMIKKKIFNFFLNKKLIDYPGDKFLIIIGSFALFLKLIYYDLGTVISDQSQSVGEGPSLFRDIIQGFQKFIYAPLIIFFSKKFYNLDIKKNYNLYFVVYFLFLIFLSFATNQRAILFDSVLFIFFVSFIYFQQGHYQIKKFFLFKIVLIFIISIPLLNIVDIISKAYLLERQYKGSRTPISNFFNTLERIKSFKDTKNQIQNLIESNDYNFYNETFYDNSVFNRFNLVLINDNFNYILKNTSNKTIAEIKDLEFNKIISIIPQPIINLFTKNFNKGDYLYESTGSFIYRSYDYSLTGHLSLGALPMITIYSFKYFWPMVLFFVSLIIFTISDSFYDNKRKIISPFVFIILYANVVGFLNIYAVAEMATVVSFIVRIIPQTIIFYLIFIFIYKKIITKKFY